jgi:hypothetical protein
MSAEFDSFSTADRLQPGDLVNENEAAAILCIEVRTLRNWRALGKGPRFVKVGERMVRYLRAELVAFVALRDKRV